MDATETPKHWGSCCGVASQQLSRQLCLLQHCLHLSGYFFIRSTVACISFLATSRPHPIDGPVCTFNGRPASNQVVQNAARAPVVRQDACKESMHIPTHPHPHTVHVPKIDPILLERCPPHPLPEIRKTLPTQRICSRTLDGFLSTLSPPLDKSSLHHRNQQPTTTNQRPTTNNQQPTQNTATHH